MTELCLTARFAAAPTGNILRLAFAPQPPTQSQHCVLVVPPLFEEMNRCRPLSGHLAKCLAASGITVETFDYSNTGDSSGDFVDANFDSWWREVAQIYQALKDNYRRVSIVAIRSAALTLMHWLQSSEVNVDDILLLAPVADGSEITHTLIKTTQAQMLFAGKRQSETEIRQTLQTAGSYEFSGYEVSQDLFAALEAVSLTSANRTVCNRFALLSWSRSDSANLPAPLQGLLVDGSFARTFVHQSHVTAAAFWRSDTANDYRFIVDQIVASGVFD